MNGISNGVSKDVSNGISNGISNGVSNGISNGVSKDVSNDDNNYLFVNWHPTRLPQIIGRCNPNIIDTENPNIINTENPNIIDADIYKENLIRVLALLKEFVTVSLAVIEQLKYITIDETKKDELINNLDDLCVQHETIFDYIKGLERDGPTNIHNYVSESEYILQEINELYITIENINKNCLTYIVI